jgi:prepilin-type N-terminal cleavage/methylation domain-containing protein
MKKLLKSIVGFTLTELIVVIAVIGILAAVLIPTITGYITKAKISADKQEVTNMNQALKLYLLENDLEDADMEASDVRNIILQTGNYSFITRSSKHAIWFDENEKKVYYGDVNQGVSASSETTNKLEDINQNGKLLLSIGGSKQAEALYHIRNLASLHDFSKYATDQYFTTDQLAYVMSFSPSKYLYIESSDSYFSGNNVAEGVIFGDDVKVLSSGQVNKVTSITKLSIPVCVLFLEEDAFSGIEIETIEQKNPDTYIEKGCFNANTLEKNPSITEEDSQVLSSANVDCLVGFFDKTLTSEHSYSFVDGLMTCQYALFQSIRFQKAKNNAKNVFVQSRITGEHLEYTYLEVDGLKVSATKTFSFLREIIPVNYYLKNNVNVGPLPSYVEKTLGGFSFELGNLDYHMEGEISSYEVSVNYKTVTYQVKDIQSEQEIYNNQELISGVYHILNTDKYLFVVTNFDKEASYTLTIAYNGYEIYKMSYK